MKHKYPKRVRDHSTYNFNRERKVMLEFFVSGIIESHCWGAKTYWILGSLSGQVLFMMQ